MPVKYAKVLPPATLLMGMVSMMPLPGMSMNSLRLAARNSCLVLSLSATVETMAFSVLDRP